MAEIGCPDKSFLKLLYYAVSSECGWPCADLRIDQLYERIPETTAAFEPVNDRLERLDAKEADGFEDDICRLANAYEMQGFLNGMRLGLKLKAEVELEA